MRVRSGFTIVELLIVIVVISILAAITVVAYNGLQQRARDAQRRSDIQLIAKALESYQVQTGGYPATSGSTAINSSWVTTADGSWANLESILVPQYISKLPSDPVSKQMSAGSYPWNDSAGYDYSIFSTPNATYCGAGQRQAYIIVYKLESGSQESKLDDCPTGTAIGPYAGSNYRTVKK